MAVIGLGRFGSSLALELMTLGAEVLGIDRNPDLAQQLNGHLTHAVTADSTKEEVLRQLSVHEMECVVVAIGNSVEASVLTTSVLLGFGITDIWVKAVSDQHARILERIGVPHVVRPEHEMGRRVAHLVRGSLQDYIPLGDGLALVRTSPPRAIIGQSIHDAHVRSRYGVTVIAMKRGDAKWSDVTGDTVLQEDDAILVTGPSERAEGFHRLT